MAIRVYINHKYNCSIIYWNPSVAKFQAHSPVHYVWGFPVHSSMGYIHSINLISQSLFWLFIMSHLS